MLGVIMNHIHKSLGHFLMFICTNLLIGIDYNTNNCFAADLTKYDIEEYSEGEKMVMDIKKYAISKQTSEKTIVLWDCDNVLQMNRDHAFREPNIQKILAKIPKARWVNVIWKSKKIIVEKWILDCTQDLDKSGVNQFVFTQCSSDSGTRHNRKLVLKKLGYNFFYNAVKLADDEFNNDEFNNGEFNISQKSLQLRLGQEQTTKPVYEDGIIYTGSASKGRTITEFFKLLNKADIKDFNVIFIDDKRKNIDEVKEACKAFGIKKFHGLNYTFAKHNTTQLTQGEIDLYIKLLTPENERTLRNVIDIL